MAKNFSLKLMSLAGALSGEKYSLGSGSNTTTSDGTPSSRDLSCRCLITAWWPRCTPSKAPIVTTQSRCRGRRLCRPRINSIESGVTQSDQTRKYSE